MVGGFHCAVKTTYSLMLKEWSIIRHTPKLSVCAQLGDGSNVSIDVSKGRVE